MRVWEGGWRASALPPPPQIVKERCRLNDFVAGAVRLLLRVVVIAMGLVLFATSAVSGLRVETIARAVLPFLAVEFLVILLITYVPAISLFLPRLFGFVQ